MGIYKRLINPSANDRQMVRAGKTVSIVLAIVAIIIAPLVAGAPDGLYDLLQKLNGIFFIPIASVMLAGLFLPKISAQGAKVAMCVGLAFYISATFIFKVDIHFVHIWGIEFVLNMAVMFAVTHFYPNQNPFQPKDKGLVEIEEWKHTKAFSSILVLLIVGIYIWLGWLI
jgi:SSS family solute:Na+ symporter